jgi:hypothetical protein
MTYVLGLIVVVLAVVAAFVLTMWGGAIVLVIGLAVVAYLTIARRENPDVGTIETGGRREPTGVPRARTSDADTANRRVGQD